MTLEDYTREFYTQHNFNCAETLIHACNACYHLGLSEEAMKMMGGFGAGMYVGSVCGALVGCQAALSSMLIQNKAHEELDVLRPAMVLLNRNFRQIAGGHTCPEIKPHHFDEQTRCLNTCLLAAKAMSQTVAQLKEKHPDLLKNA